MRKSVHWSWHTFKATYAGSLPYYSNTNRTREFSFGGTDGIYFKFWKWFIVRWYGFVWENGQVWVYSRRLMPSGWKDLKRLNPSAFFVFASLGCAFCSPVYQAQDFGMECGLLLIVIFVEMSSDRVGSFHFDIIKVFFPPFNKRSSRFANILFVALFASQYILIIIKGHNKANKPTNLQRLDPLTTDEVPTQGPKPVW